MFRVFTDRYGRVQGFSEPLGCWIGGRGAGCLFGLLFAIFFFAWPVALIGENTLGWAAEGCWVVFLAALLVILGMIGGHQARRRAGTPPYPAAAPGPRDWTPPSS